MIGVIGGTFDPIHFGHLRPALEIAEQFQLDQLRFIPSAKPPHRWQPVADAEHRLNMVKLAIADTHGFIVDDREYHREGSSYTVDTLRSLRADLNADKSSESILMILGQDAFQSFREWHEWQNILTLAHIVVSSRPGYQFNNESWMKGRVRKQISDLHREQAGGIYFCEVTQLDISATTIRKQILAGKSSRYLLPQSVEAYINKHQLYKANKADKAN